MAVSYFFRIITTIIQWFSACNAVAMLDMGILTMKNYGLRRNCTTSIIFPEQIRLLNIDVGVTSEQSPLEAELGLTNQVSILTSSTSSYYYIKNGQKYLLICSEHCRCKTVDNFICTTYFFLFLRNSSSYLFYNMKWVCLKNMFLHLSVSVLSFSKTC